MIRLLFVILPQISGKSVLVLFRYNGVSRKFGGRK